MGYFISSKIDTLSRKAHAKSLMPYIVELGCCGSGLRTFENPHASPHGAFPEYAVSPRHADLLLVSGTVTLRTAEHIRRIFLEMPEPRYVMAFGNCAISGGPYWQYGYHVLKGVDQVIPVDIYVPGCPPSFDDLMEGLENLKNKILFAQNPS